jgi:hypothetical protein
MSRATVFVSASSAQKSLRGLDNSAERVRNAQNCLRPFLDPSLPGLRKLLSASLLGKHLPYLLPPRKLADGVEV